MDCPTDSTLVEYVRELKIRGVSSVVRVCEPTYDRSLLEANGINVHDWPYSDGGLPPQQILQSFLALCDKTFECLLLPKEIVNSKQATLVNDPPVIAVHCVAGLGRAPVLVAVALIEAGLAPVDAIEFIRKCRRGAFNGNQLKYLIDVYKKRSCRNFGFFKRSPSPEGFFSKIFKKKVFQ
jgi:protein tyrosine phosphatase type 4A